MFKPNSSQQYKELLTHDQLTLFLISCFTVIRVCVSALFNVFSGFFTISKILESSVWYMKPSMTLIFVSVVPVNNFYLTEYIGFINIMLKELKLLCVRL
jgi:hypothetical protein